MIYCNKNIYPTPWVGIKSKPCLHHAHSLLAFPCVSWLLMASGFNLALSCSLLSSVIGLLWVILSFSMRRPHPQHPYPSQILPVLNCFLKLRGRLHLDVSQGL